MQRAQAVGGRVSMAATPEGGERVYELNVSYLDALCHADELTDDAVVVAKALAAHAALLSVVGVPAIYLHSLVGSASDLSGMARSGINRRINRAVLHPDTLAADVASGTRRGPILRGLLHLLRVRAGRPEFSPFAAQRVVRLDPRVFAVRRGQGDGVLALVNVTGESVHLPGVRGRDLLTGREHPQVTLGPYAHLWLE